MDAPAYTAAELASRFGLDVAGDPGVVVRGVATLAGATPETLGFLANPRYRNQLAESRAGIVVMRADDADGYAGTALLARVFQLTQPALMRIAWFAWGYNLFVPWRDAVFAKVRATWAWRYGRIVKARAKKAAAAACARLKPGIAAIAEDIQRRVRAFLGQT